MERIEMNFAICLYLLLAGGMQLLFWLIPPVTVSSVAVALVGFSLEPLFPVVVVATTKLLPPHLHVAIIEFAAAFGGSRACVLPIAVGAIASAISLYVLQPIILAMLLFAAFLWTVLGMSSIRQQEGK